jgi:hypothetical protein
MKYQIASACLLILIAALGAWQMAAAEPLDDDFAEVEIAVAVSDFRDAAMEQDRALEVVAQGVCKPANKIAASVFPKAHEALLNVKTNAEGKLIAAEIVKVKVKRLK